MAYENESNVTGAGTGAPVVVGLFANAEDAHRAVTQLRENGFSSNQIGAAFRNRRAGSLHGEGNRLGTTETTETSGHAHEGWWEKLKDAFTGNDTAEYQGSREGVSSSASAGTSGYATDDYEYDYSSSEMEGSLAGTGIPSDRAGYLTQTLQPGGAIVTVRDAARSEEAEQIITSNNGTIKYENTSAGATDTAYPQSTGSDYGTTGAQDYAATGTRGDVTNETDRVRLFGEVLRVHKDRVSRGEVRLRKDVITENQTIEVPVTREEFVLERVPVTDNTPATGATIGEQKEIRIPLSEERVRVEKQPIVTEEVIVGKREVTDVERVGDQVRHEELRVDDNNATTRKRESVNDLDNDLNDDTRRSA